MRVSEEKRKAQLKEMHAHGLFEKDISEHFETGSGKGGQKVNRTANCVFLKHEPTGLMVRCQRERSREQNRFFARRLLLEKIKKNLGVVTKKELAAEKKRRQKARRRRRTKKKLQDD